MNVTVPWRQYAKAGRETREGYQQQHDRRADEQPASAGGRHERLEDRERTEPEHSEKRSDVPGLEEYRGVHRGGGSPWNDPVPAAFVLAPSPSAHTHRLFDGSR